MHSSALVRRAFAMLSTASLMLVGLVVAAVPAQAVSDDVVISQVYGGGGNSGAPYTHDFVELFNRGTSAVSLAGMSIQYASATGTGNFGANSGQLTDLPDVILQPGQYYLVQQAGGTTGVPLPAPDLVDPTPINLAGASGKVALAEGTASLGCNGGGAACDPAQVARIVDLVGYGSANFFEGSTAAPGLSNSAAAFRAEGGCTDTDNNGADFTAGAPVPRNSSTPLAPCSGDPVDQPPTTTCPPSLFAPFDEGATAPVSATDDNDGIGAIAITSTAVDGITLEDVDLSTGSATLTVAGTTAPGFYEVAVQFATDAVTPQTSTCIVDVTVQSPPAPVLISEVQGTGSASPVAGQLVDVEGIVTSLFTNNDVLDGFFLQEEASDWDDDPNTSEGIFVFCRSECPADGELAVGDLAGVRGEVIEFFGMTQVSSNVTAGSIDVISSGNPLPPPTEVELPAAGSTRDAGTFENVEGMVVEFTDTLVVSEYFELARYGQITLTVDERPYQFTHSNAPSVEGYSAFLEDLATRRIILDDDNNNQNDAVTAPDDNEPYPWPQGGLSVDNRFRGGDTIENLVGVMHWSFAGQGGTDAWRIRPIQGMDYEFTSANPAPSEPQDVGGRLTVTSYNVLNYFATVDPANICGPSSNQDCRGADSELERERQLTKIAAALAEIDADVAGLIEIENDGDDESANQIVAALNGLTSPGTYAAIETGFIGTDAIKVALIYQPGTATPVGDYAILDTSVDARFDDGANRPVLIQTFEENSTGERFTIAVNHLKSKGSACGAADPNLNDGQGNCNLTRTAAAEALSDYLFTDPTGSGDSDFLIAGDLNAYAMEDPITTLEAEGWTDLHEEFEGPDGYSYVFDGQLGYLDTALANASLLAQVTGATAWHINADEVPLFDYNDEFRTGDEASFERESNALPLYAPDPLRSSDHDPIIVGLALGDPAQVVTDLRETVARMGIQRGISNALDAKLRAAERAIGGDDLSAACGSLQAFINQVNALEGKKITTEQAGILIDEAVAARVMLAC